MTYQETSPSPPAGSGDETENVVRQYDSLIAASKAAIERLNTTLREENEKCELLIAHREEAQSLVGMQSRLRAMHERARQYGIFTPQADPPVTLRIVPSQQDREHPTPHRESPVIDEDAPHQARAGRPPAEITVRSQKQQQVLSVIASRPELLWGSEDIAKVLGIPKNARARKSLRNCLRNLLMIDALERVTLEDDRRVYYRPRMNWKFA
ncbi:hypothetical protein AB0L42_25265 [Streptomyces sp. NPDC052287]|uniref:hypothetical protein n=1 Tax=Streptomyces sp. NPDC052287 TaxID=3154950 RepID=UPI0034234080